MTIRQSVTAAIRGSSDKRMVLATTISTIRAEQHVKRVNEQLAKRGDTDMEARAERDGVGYTVYLCEKGVQAVAGR